MDNHIRDTPNQATLKKYRTLLGEKYKEYTDEDVLSLATRLKGIYEVIINNYLETRLWDG